MTRIVLVDDHKMLRGILRGLLESEPGLEIVGEAEDGLQALQMTETVKPDLVITDLRMEKMDGLELTKTISGIHPSTRVIILTMHSDQTYIAQAMDAGAYGYVLKGADLDDLLCAIREVSGGQHYLSPALNAPS